MSHFSFANPPLLLLLAVPILLIMFECWKRPRDTRLPLDGSGRPGGGVVMRLVQAFEFIPALILAVVLLLLAGPQVLDEPRQERETTNIEICLDVSGSMSSNVSSGRSRYEAATDSIAAFTDMREGDAFGLTIFGGENVRWTPLTKDLRAIKLATPFMNPRKMPPHMGSTRIGAAIEACMGTLLRTEEGDRMIILISDGQSSDLNGGRATVIGRELAEAGITLYAIHVGSGQAPAQLAELVRPTLGDVFASNDENGLIEIFEHIDRMKPARLRQAGAQPIDHYLPLSIVGLALLALLQLGMFGLRYTPW
ncbi:MAG: aerotolerance regulator BatA [Phycisphaerae bacterium]|nr:aerotolerance regulator BatA [Phycisphaerae bacterium]